MNTFTQDQVVQTPKVGSNSGYDRTRAILEKKDYILIRAFRAAPTWPGETMPEDHFEIWTGPTSRQSVMIQVWKYGGCYVYGGEVDGITP